MDNSDRINQIFGPSQENTKPEKATLTPTPIIPPLPDLPALISKIKRQADKAKTIEGKVGFIDVGIEELKQIKIDGLRQYHELVDQNNLDEPDPFWNYDADLDKQVNVLGIFRQRLLLEDAERKASPVREEVAEAAPAFAAIGRSVAPPAEALPTAPEVMDIKQLATLFDMSESWLYKNYESEGIPHFCLGTNLRFRRDEILDWIGHRGKNSASGTSTIPKAEAGGKQSRNTKDEDTKRSDKLSSSPRDGELDSQTLSTRPEPNQRTKAITEKLIPLLCSKLLLDPTEASKLREWLLNNAPARNLNERINWPHDDRRSLATFLVLCQHADLIHLPPTRKLKSPMGPGYSVALRNGFLMSGGEITETLGESIDRSHFSPIEKQVAAFETMICDMVRTDIDPGRPWPHQLFCALETYFGEIVGSRDYSMHEKNIAAACKTIDMSVMRIFYEVSVELPELTG